MGPSRWDPGSVLVSVSVLGRTSTEGKESDRQVRPRFRLRVRGEHRVRQDVGKDGKSRDPGTGGLSNSLTYVRFRS